MGLGVNGSLAGEKAQVEMRYKNLKAQGFWEAAKWVRDGRRLLKYDKFRHLPRVKYKVSIDQMFQIVPKEGFTRWSGESPN